MNKEATATICKTVICPRCNEEIEWEYPNPPSRGWICRYCRWALKIRNPSSHFRPRLMNDMEERKLEEYRSCEPSEIFQFGQESQEEILGNIFNGGIALNEKKKDIYAD
jgi:hypothetical protein